MFDIYLCAVPAALAARPASLGLSNLADLVRSYAPYSEVRSIAVVANAPLTPDADRASAIDACDLVIRCNSFVLDRPSRPRRLGRKVNVVVFNRALVATPDTFDRYRDRLYLMVEPGRLHREPSYYPGWWPTDLGVVPVPNATITLPLSRALRLPTETEPQWATTGLMSMWIARTLFPDAEMLISGFSMIEQPDQTEWSHEFGDSCIVGPEHRIAVEGSYLRTLVDSQRVRWMK